MNTMIKSILAGTFLFCILSFLNAQDIEGAWLWEGIDDEGNRIEAVAILMDGFQVATWYTKEDHRFLHTNGGTYQMNGNILTEGMEFNSMDTARIGKSIQIRVEFRGDSLILPEYDMGWKRIDDGTPGALAGPWLFSGRIRDGEIRERDTDQPRKTMKILSGSRFQWIAYNTETKQFMGTGGGNYTTEDGKYTEHIDFFSRDDSRVGAKLGFDYALKDGKWHHSGKSSKGDPMYELWSPRKK